MRKKPTVTIGIPAYNEEANIGRLLKDILAQKGNFNLEKIIVACDGSTDRTVGTVREMLDGKSTGFVIEGRVRKGKTKRLNEIYRSTDSDVLVTLDGDIVIKDDYFIEKIITPIVRDGADLVSNRLVPLDPCTFTERVLSVSISFKNEMEELLNNGDNLYSCHGTSRAFSKKLYRNFRPPNIVAEDAFSYLYAKENGYKYQYTDQATTYFKLPDNITDHGKQSVRFFSGQGELKRYFSEDFVRKYHQIPRSLLISTILKYLGKHPPEVITYLFFVTLMRMKSTFVPKQTVKWQIAESTRKVKY